MLRLSVRPETVNEVTEQLNYEITETGENEGSISLAWEKVKIQIPFKVEK